MAPRVIIKKLPNMRLRVANHFVPIQLLNLAVANNMRPQSAGNNALFKGLAGLYSANLPLISGICVRVCVCLFVGVSVH